MQKERTREHGEERLIIDYVITSQESQCYTNNFRVYQS